MTPAIRTRGLARAFGPVAAVDGVDLEVPAGCIFGLLGPNGAGKSTTLRLLAGILRPDRGRVEILGLDLQRHTNAVKRRIGYVAQHFALYPELTARENLEFYSALYGVRPGAAVLSDCGLAGLADRRAGRLSGGTRRRLSLACALAHDPPLLCLDEPTAGIDPVTRKEIWEIFYRLAAAGKTLFVTTHYMEEAERCHRLAFLHHGRLVAEGTPRAILAGLTGLKAYTADVAYSPELAARLQALAGVQVINPYGDRLRIVTDARLPPEALAAASAGALPEPALRPAPLTIEDAFMALTTEAA